jgi:hypothetical protein
MIDPKPTDTFVTFDASKVAISVVELGTVCGLQFAAVFHSPVVGFLAQVALAANEDPCRVINSSAAATSKLNLLQGVVMGELVGRRSLDD